MITDNYHKKKVVSVIWPCIETEWTGEYLPSINDGRKESTRKTVNLDKTQWKGWGLIPKFSGNIGCL